MKLPRNQLRRKEGKEGEVQRLWGTSGECKEDVSPCMASSWSGKGGRMEEFGGTTPGHLTLRRVSDGAASAQGSRSRARVGGAAEEE